MNNSLCVFYPHSGEVSDHTLEWYFGCDRITWKMPCYGGGYLVGIENDYHITWTSTSDGSYKL